MDAVTLLALSLMGVNPTPVPFPVRDTGVVVGAESIPHSPDALDRWQSLIAEASRRFSIPVAWIRAVMRAESAGRIKLGGVPITSRAGAMGLMQVMPETYAAMRLRYGLGPDPYDPRDNILAGTAYLRELYERYGYPALFAAYNAGPMALDGYLSRGLSLPSETLSYLSAISPTVHDSILAARTPTAPLTGSSTALEVNFNSVITSPQRLFFPLETGHGLGDSLAPKAVSHARSGTDPSAILVGGVQDSGATRTSTGNGLFVVLNHDP